MISAGRHLVKNLIACSLPMNKIRALIVTVFSCLLVTVTWALDETAVKYYTAVPRSGTDVVELGPVVLPCCITGRVSAVTKPLIVTLLPQRTGRYAASIVPYTGTGVVYAAETRLAEGEFAPPLTAVSTNLDLSARVVCVFTVGASRAQTGDAFAIRLGETGPVPVTFSGNGGVVSTNVVPYQPGYRYGTLPSAIRTGYDFKGWATAPTNGLPITSNSVVCLAHSTLHAQWTRSLTPVSPTNDPLPSVTNYVVTFNANGGYGDMPTQTFVYGEAKALATNLFARTNHTFKGWATAPAGEVRYADHAVVSNLTKEVNGKVPLYAQWMISADQVKTQTVDGVTWRYTVEGTGATIHNISGGQYVAAVDRTVRGTLVIPETLGGVSVTEIGERAFHGCAGVTNIVIPLTVESIGNEAFAGCSGLKPGITVPESVESLGTSVFSGCTSLKIVRYYGNCPSVDDGLYKGAPRDLISGVLRVRADWPTEETEPVETEDDEDDVEGGGVTTLSARWPEGGEGRGIYWLRDVKVYTVTLDCNGGALADSDEPRFRSYLPGRMIGELPEAERTDENTELVFDGWFTARLGGRRVEEDLIVGANMTLYAHWRREDERETSGWEAALYDDDEETSLSRAAVYSGYLYLETGSNDCQVVGTVSLKLSKGRYDRTEETMVASVSASVRLFGSAATRTFKGLVDDAGTGTLVATKDAEDELEITLTENNLSGSYGEFLVAGARDRTASSKTLDKQFVAASLARWGGTWTVALQASEAEGAGAACAENCYSVLTAKVGAKGKTKVTGTLSDGTKVSLSAQMIFGDGCACVPVLAPLYARKAGGFALLLWFSTDEEAPLSVWGVTDWDAAASKTPFTATLECVAAGRSDGFVGEAAFTLGGVFDIDGLEIDEALLPENVPVAASKAKWSLPRPDTVTFNREDAGYEITRDNGNPAGLKLAYASSTGAFKGTFTLYAVNEAEKSRKVKATVAGGVVGAVGYGSAFVKGVGSVPVMVTPEAD